MLTIDKSAQISDLADIEKSSKGTKIFISKKVVIDSFVKLKSVGGKGNIFIDEQSYINSGTVIYSGNGILIGKNVLIAANCTLAPVNHEFKSKHKLINEQRFQPSKGGIIIEDDVWIGSNTIILDGSVIQKGAVVCAGSLVNSNLPKYSVSKGMPAKVFKYRE